MCSRWRRSTAEAAAIVCVFCASLAFVLLFSARARADAELEIAWSAPPACPDGPWALARVAAHLGRAIGASATATLSTRVEIAELDAGFRMRVITARNGAEGERILENAKCEELAEAATLMIALAVDPNAVLGAEPTLPASPTAVRPATDSEKPPILQPKPRVDPKRNAWPDRGLRARAGVLGDAGFLPALGFAPELRLSVHRRAIGAELGGFWFPARESKGAQSVTVGLWAVVLRACPHLVRERFWLGGCAGVDLGRTSAKGHGLTQNLRKRALFLGVAASLQLRLRMVGPLWLLVEPGLSIPLLRQRFVTLDTTDMTTNVLHTPRSVSARGNLGLEVSF